MNLFKAFLDNFNGVEREIDENEMYNSYEENDEEEVVEEQRSLPFFKSKPRVSNIQDYSQIKVEILRPINYEDAFTIIESLKERRAVIINVEGLDGAKALRILDTVTGGAKALNGHIEKVTNQIFIVAPKNYSIDNAEERMQVKSQFFRR